MSVKMDKIPMTTKCIFSHCDIAAVATEPALSIRDKSQKKNIPAIISRSLVKHCPTLIIFGRHIPEKILLEAVTQFPISPRWCFCTTWGNKKV